MSISPSLRPVLHKYYDIVDVGYQRERRVWEERSAGAFNCAGYFIGPITGPLRAFLGSLDVISGIFTLSMKTLNHGLANIIRGAFEASPIAVAYLTGSPDLTIGAYVLYGVVAAFIDLTVTPTVMPEVRADSTRVDGHWVPATSTPRRVGA